MPSKGLLSEEPLSSLASYWRLPKPPRLSQTLKKQSWLKKFFFQEKKKAFSKKWQKPGISRGISLRSRKKTFQFLGQRRAISSWFGWGQAFSQTSHFTLLTECGSLCLHREPRCCPTVQVTHRKTLDFQPEKRRASNFSSVTICPAPVQELSRS